MKMMTKDWIVKRTAVFAAVALSVGVGEAKTVEFNPVKEHVGHVEPNWNMFDRRLGMFVHWGIYSAGGLHEQEQMRYRRTREEYNKRMAEFGAELFTGDNLIDVAESAGAEYIVLTSKHHDGFCMWNTRTTDFNVMNSAARRDLVGELAAACRRRGMKLGFYFSNPDWHQPFAHNAASTHQIELQPGDAPDREKYVALVRAQVTELLTNYGEIVCFFWDIPTGIDLPEMDELVRKLQPGIMINDRGWGNKATCDYSTPERDYKWALGNRHVEACDAVGVHSWGYRINEDYRTTGYLTRNIDRYLSTGGNYLLNVGPKADGSLPAETLRCMRSVGRWYAKVRDSYRSVVSETNLVQDAGFTTTRRGNEVFLHFREAPMSSGLFLHSFDRIPREALVLNTGTPLKTVVEMSPWSWSDATKSAPCLHLMGIPADELANEAVVIRLTFDSL